MNKGYGFGYNGILKSVFCVSLVLLAQGVVQAKVRVHHIFDNNMVLQRDKAVRIWGWAEAGEPVSVEFAGRRQATTAGKDGKWAVELQPMPASHESRTLTARGPENTVVFDNVLVGDVWVLGGQSNMEFPIERVYHGDVEIASAHQPNVRLMTIPVNASQTVVEDFPRINEFNAWNGEYEEKGYWRVCTPESVKRFSAIGYIFGRRLCMAARVPIGLIDASRGGTTVEAWTSRAMLATIPDAEPLLTMWDEKVAAYDPNADLRRRVERWEQATEDRRKKGLQPQPKPTEPSPSPAMDQNNPGASYNGMLAVFGGLSVRGAIFNQGFNNALADARPRLYAKVFNAMIRDWRRTFRDETMPFGVVGLTAGGTPQTLENFELTMLDAGAFLREGQLRAARDLPNVGFVCAYDQQVNWYHPFKKVELGERIARWALATQYGLSIGWQPAACVSVEKADGCIVLTFDRALDTHDGRPIEGFAVAGHDRHFFPAHAQYRVVGKDERGQDRIDRQKVEVSSEFVPDPVAARYAWARNPLGNLANREHFERIIPVPSFRTDTWDWPEAPFSDNRSPEAIEHRAQLNRMRKQAGDWIGERLIRQAEAVLEASRRNSPK